MRAVTFLFHDVVPPGCWDASGFAGSDADIYKLACGDFRRHLAAIAEGFPRPALVMSELLCGRSEPNPEELMLTFDDGGVSAALYIADLLDEFGWKAHFLITTSRIGTRGFVDAGQIR